MSSAAKSTSAAACSIIYLGMDVHKVSITIALLPEGAKSPTRFGSITKRFTEAEELAWADCAGRRDSRVLRSERCGYVIHRAMKKWGYECEVIAPSLIPRRPGVQRKHDKRDAADLARFYRAGEPRRSIT